MSWFITPEWGLLLISKIVTANNVLQGRQGKSLASENKTHTCHSEARRLHCCWGDIQPVASEWLHIGLWEANMEGEVFRVNMGKTKVLISGPGLDLLQKSDKNPCAACQGHRHKLHFCVVVASVGSTSNAMVSLAV